MHARGAGPADEALVDVHEPLAAEALTTPSFLDGMSERAGRYSALQRRAVPHGQSWLTATATAGLGGVPNVSDAFVSSLWMLDALGAAAKARTSVFIRDEIFCGAETAFAGSIWEDKLPPYCIIRVLKNNSIVVKPDYFTALLWKRLIGRRLLDATVESSPVYGDSKLRAYAFCGPGNRSVTTMLVNLGSDAINTTVAVGPPVPTSIQSDRGGGSGGGGGGGRHVWHLTAGEGGLHSARIKVNGRLMPSNGVLPTASELAGVAAASDGVVLLPGHSAAFVLDGALSCGGSS